MVKIGDIVLLKSGGPEMKVSYIIQSGEGTRDKAARMKGFKKGDLVCEYMQEMATGHHKLITNTFKAVCLTFSNGKFLVEGNQVIEDEEEEDDDDDW